MELLAYLFIKPFLLLLETLFTIFGRILETRADIMICFLVGLFFFVPLYIELKSFQNKWLSKLASKKSGKRKEDLCKSIIYIAMGHVLPLLCQIMIAFSVCSFSQEIIYLKDLDFLMIEDLSIPDGIIGQCINVLPLLFLVIISFISVLNKKDLYVKIVSIAEGLILTFFIYNMPSLVSIFWLLFSIVLTFAQIIVLVCRNISEKGVDTKLNDEKRKEQIETPDFYIFFGGVVYIILLAGYYIPTNIIKASTQEFVDITDIQNPMHYVAYSMALSFGFWGIFGSGYYLFAETKTKLILERVIWVMAGTASIDYLLAGAYQGEISSSLAYFDPKEFDISRIIISIIFTLIIMLGLLVVIEKKKSFVKLLVTVQVGVLIVSILMNTVKILYDYRHMEYLNEGEENIAAGIKLSKNGNNVVVLIMDRALGPVVPFLFEEKPELKEQFDGFIYYPNTVSFGAYTNTGIPAVYGGYEYTPEAINKRKDESLADKHNEALKVLPKLFSQNGYDVTVIDPAYAGYNWIPDLTIFNEIAGMNAYRLEGTFKDQYPVDYVSDEEMLKRNFFFHAVMKMMPLNWQDLLYDSGNYCDLNSNQCIRTSRYTQDGYHTNFLNNYYVLKNLSKLTILDDEENNCFVSLYNGTPHMECLLQEPNYVPVRHVDNRDFHLEDDAELHAGDRTINNWLPVQVEFFHVDMATFLMLGEWFDYLKQNDCYDNTRIIIVADHGADTGHLDFVLDNNMDVEAFMPMLLMKDFNAHGYEESDERMTNADVPYLATKGLIDNPLNPFTGNLLDAHEKGDSDEFHVFYSENNTLNTNHGNVYKPDLWFSVKGNPYIRSNWSYLGKY